jgi:hypothetical protein
MHRSVRRLEAHANISACDGLLPRCADSHDYDQELEDKVMTLPLQQQPGDGNRLAVDFLSLPACMSNPANDPTLSADEATP